MSESVVAEKLDAIIAELKAIQPTGLERSLAVGRLIFDQFFQGSVQVWHDRRRGKDHSLRRLAQRPGCPMSRSALHQAVSVYVASWTIDNLERYVHVGLSHVAAVLRTIPSDRQRLLGMAEKNLWSVRRLREEIACGAQPGGARRGRPPRPPVDRAKAHLRQCMQVLLDAADSLAEVSALHQESGAGELRLLLDDVARAQEQLALVVTGFGRNARPAAERSSA